MALIHLSRFPGRGRPQPAGGPDAHAGKFAQRGGVAVEFALGALIFFSVLLAVIEGGRATLMKAESAWLAREGARYASVRGNSRANSAEIATQAMVLTYLQGLSPSLTSAELAVTWPDGTQDNSPGSRVQVTVSRPFNSIVPLVGSFTASSRSELVISY